MELPDGTPSTAAETHNSSNIVRGLASDIKITLKNKTTIITPIQKPAGHNKGIFVDVAKEGTSADSTTSVNPKSLPQVQKYMPKFKDNKQKNNSPLVYPSIAHSVSAKPPPKIPSYPGDFYVSAYPKGIPKSFLIKKQLAQAPVPIDSYVKSTTEKPLERQNEPEKLVKQYNIPHLEIPAWIKTVGESYEEDIDTVQTKPGGGSAPAYASEQRPTPAQASLMNDFNLDADEDVSSSNKRGNVFESVGPLMPTPKKPKMTINLLYKKNNADYETEREESRSTPVTQRREVVLSKDETVVKYLRLWPWREDFALRRTISGVDKGGGNSLDFEKLIEENERGHVFIKVAISKYSENLTKEQLLDITLDRIGDKPFVPCFIEFSRTELKWLVTGHRSALTALYAAGLRVRHGGRVMPLSLALTTFKNVDVNFVTKVLSKKLLEAFDGEKKLDLRAFCMKKDIMHFIYFPLNRITNQIQLRQLDVIEWNYLIELDLSDNKLQSVDGFELAARAPRLSVLNLSNNLIQKVSILLSCRGLSLKSLCLEGNPLCNDYYTDPARYIQVVRLIFPTLIKLDGTEIVLPGELPPPVKNFCPVLAIPIVEKYLETFFPLLEAPPHERVSLREMYDEDCVFTMTHNLMYSGKFRHLRPLLSGSRAPAAGRHDAVRGAPAVAQLLARWPALAHDHSTFLVDVLDHSETSTVIRVMGAAKTTAATLADDEHLLSFTRTVVLASEDHLEYKVCNEMLYWDKPTKELEARAFTVTSIKPMISSTKFESTPDDDLKEKLVAILVAYTGLNVEQSQSCLEKKQWDLRAALEHYVRFADTDQLHLMKA